jgi:hypothetical protein
MPGWLPSEITYVSGKLSTKVISMGSKIGTLFEWAKENNASVDLQQNGIDLSLPVKIPKPRSRPAKIYPLKQVIASFTDGLANVYPGNHIQLSIFNKKNAFMSVTMTVQFAQMF